MITPRALIYCLNHEELSSHRLLPISLQQSIARNIPELEKAGIPGSKGPAVFLTWSSSSMITPRALIYCLNHEELSSHRKLSIVGDHVSAIDSRFSST
jgi:hypothetical protein